MWARESSASGSWAGKTCSRRFPMSLGKAGKNGSEGAVETGFGKLRKIT